MTHSNYWWNITEVNYALFEALHVSRWRRQHVKEWLENKDISMYPKYIIRYASNTDRNRLYLFYRLQDVYNQILQDWGNYDMAVQPYVICKSRKASMLRYEVFNKTMVKSWAISSDYNIIDFPYLDQNEKLNTRKDVLNMNGEKENSTKSSKNKPQIHEVNNSELMKYFWVSTEVDLPKVNLVSWRPAVYPAAEKMARDIVNILNANIKPKGYEIDWVLVDFIESIEGITYFTQVKSFTVKK
jgi:hypothetical protein